MTAAQARELGLEAIRLGRADLAVVIAQKLLALNRRDAFAQYLLATAYLRLNRPAEAEAAGRLAFRFGQTSEQRYQSARLTALAAYGAKRYGRAQWWLRRAAQNAPEAARRAQSVAEFGAVRARNPWRLELQFSLVPSDNVNNGSAGRFNIIDGLPYVGVLSADAQALSGVISEAGINAAYRLARTGQRETELGASLNLRRVDLSRAARSLLPPGTNTDYGAQRLEISLRQQWLTPANDQRFTLSAAYGRQWYGAGADYDYGALGFGHQLSIGPRSLLDSGLSVEQRAQKPGQTRPDRIYGLRAGLSHGFANGDKATVTGFASAFSTGLPGQSSTSFGGQISYALGHGLGPVSLSGSIGYQVADFPGYGIAGIIVPGGRQDRSLTAELELGFDRLSYLGFAPVIGLRSVRTQSNVSRFDSSETALTLGLRSTF